MTAEARHEALLPAVESEVGAAYRRGVINGIDWMHRGEQRLCCYVEEREHPTYPTYSDHPFGEHPLIAPMVGCSLCNANLNAKVKQARAVLDAEVPA